MSEGVGIVKRLSMIIFIAGGLFAGIVRAEDLLAGADIGYGEYLSSECVTCHSQNGTSSGIPAINGLDAEAFATVMHAYKAGDLEHPVMRMVAGRLDHEQIASLAVYFASRPATQ